MAVPDWDPVMLTIYLNGLHSETPKQTPISEVRRRSVVDMIVVDLRQSSDQQDHGRDRGDSEDGRPKPLDIYPVKD